MLDNGGSGGSGASVSVNGNAILYGLTILNNSTSDHCLAVGAGSTVMCLNVTAQAPNGTSGSIFYAPSGNIQFGSGCVAIGNAASLIAVSGGGQAYLVPNTALSIQGTPTYSAATIVASALSQFNLGGGSAISGSANGQRYISVSNSLVNTNGGGQFALPGSTNGTTSTGGLYT